MCLVDYRALHIASLTRRFILEQIGGLSGTFRRWEAEEINYQIAKAGQAEAGPQEDHSYYWRIHRDGYYTEGDQASYQTTPVALGCIELMLQTADCAPICRLPLSLEDRQEVPRSRPSRPGERDARLDLMKRRCKTCRRTITGKGHGYLIDCADRDADRIRP